MASIINSYTPSTEEHTPFEIICDPIGFSQHSGECWSDAILQAFAFSDLTRSIVQPKLYYFNRDSFKIPKKTFMMSGNKTNNPLAIDLIEKYAARFKIHYDYITKLYKECESLALKRKYDSDSTFHKCLEKYRALIKNTNIPSNSTICPLLKVKATLKRRMSANYGPAIEKTARMILQNKHFRNSSGGSTWDIINYADFINDIFGMKFYTEEIATGFMATLQSPNDITIKSALNNIFIITGSYTFSLIPNHATALYMCDGNLVYFDNNVGVIYFEISTNLRRQVQDKNPTINNNSVLLIYILKYIIENKLPISYNYNNKRASLNLADEIRDSLRKVENYGPMFGPSRLFFPTNIFRVFEDDNSNYTGGYKKRLKSQRKTRRNHK